jgi:hypothetical protein
VADHLARKHGLLVDLIQDAMFDGEWKIVQRLD